MHMRRRLGAVGVTERGARLAQAAAAAQWIVSDSGHVSGRRLWTMPGSPIQPAPRLPCGRVRPALGERRGIVAIEITLASC